MIFPSGFMTERIRRKVENLVTAVGDVSIQFAISMGGVAHNFIPVGYQVLL